MVKTKIIIMNDLIWIEISKAALKNNIQTIRRIIGPNILLAPCVKSNAYGHGLIEISKLFLEYGANWLCVNSLEEAIALRQAEIREPILIIGYVQKNDLAKILEFDLRLFIYEQERLKILSNLAKKHNQKAKIHLKIDTGMHRQGIMMDEIDDYIHYIKSLPDIELEGIATHFANSDEPEKPAYFYEQMEKFKKVKEKFEKAFNHQIIFHCDKSASSLIYPHKISDLDRPGLAIYGYYPSQSVRKICEQKNIKLLPSLSLKTKIALIKKIPAGSLVGYGCTYQTTRPTTIAIVPIGYYDGVDRKLSNRGHFLISGKKAPIIGRVCMNITIVDITDIENINQEDEVVVIGQQGDEQITTEQFADWAGTINYEVTTRLRESIKRYYI